MNHVEDGQTIGGNYGLLDMQMAIKFVVENCPNIGCDPNNVSIFGESAGGAAIAYLIMGHEISQVTYFWLSWLNFKSFLVFPYCNPSITVGYVQYNSTAANRSCKRSYTGFRTTVFRVCFRNNSRKFGKFGFHRSGILEP